MIHALKLIRPISEPARIITVIAAKTNWKNIIVAIGKASAGMPDAAAGMIACPSRKAGESAGCGVPQNGNSCGPKDMLYAHSTQTTITAAKAYSAMKAELIAHF